MDKQITLSAFSDELANVRTKKKGFLAQIDRIVPWGEWVAEIKPCYYKGERGNKPYDLELMLRNLYATKSLLAKASSTLIALLQEYDLASIRSGFSDLICSTFQKPR